MQINLTTFERIRFRALVGYVILAFIATILSVIILGILLPAWFKGKSSPLREPLILLLLYVFFSLFTFSMLSRAGLCYNRLLGKFPPWRTLGLYSLWAVPQVIFTLSAFFLLYFPISFFMPEFFKERFIEDTSMVLLSSDRHVLANLLNFLTSVFLAPVIEEFFFRGILLTRWTVKWGVARSIFASSFVFAFLHLDPIGAFCFGCVMAVFYIRTKSLFIPMSIHIANNSIPSIIGWFEILFEDSPSQQGTLEEFQELWWIGLVGFVILIPCAIYFWRHYIRDTDWRVPYLIESDGCENKVPLSD